MCNESVLIKRINRKLANDGERVRTYRGQRWLSSLGTHYIVDVRGAVVAAHVDPEQIGRDLGVLLADERVA